MLFCNTDLIIMINGCRIVSRTSDGTRQRVRCHEARREIVGRDAYLSANRVASAEQRGERSARPRVSACDCSVMERRVQACGATQPMNFGGFATPERNTIFHIDDPDETLPTPVE
ncbi:DUF2252 domain-containing protein [Paraburkholderia panacisoli]|uniref:DUF2252 domain-containing protein n=1 Tax=Paraburkholderia panacisoli TaxID=2603818 RepID=A0A5B0GGC3_9BURK|nr:DUF2252 domain-containing protein [Paraburkholderia panacisoli]